MRLASSDKAKAKQLPVQARRHPFVNALRRGLLRCGVVSQNATSAPVPVVIGVSGGADSVALLLGCVALKHRRSAPKVTPIAVHVHHHLRESADDDAEWVRELCARFDVPLHVAHVHPRNTNGNLSANARRLRYHALSERARSEKAQFVAVAHHCDDQFETLIAALCRGAGLNGMAGMPWARTLHQNIQLVRPLLDRSHQDCEDFCRAAGIAWRIDPSNADVTQTRARLRHEIIPMLEQLWPTASRRAAVVAEELRAARALLEAKLNQSFGPADQRTWTRESLQSLPLPLITAGLRRAALAWQPKVKDRLRQRHLMRAAEHIASSDRSPHHYDLPGGLRLDVVAKLVTLAGCGETQGVSP